MNKKKSQELDEEIKQAQSIAALPFKDRLRYCASDPALLAKTVTLMLAVFWLLSIPFVKYSLVILAISDILWLFCSLALAVYFALIVKSNQKKKASLISKTAAWALLIAYFAGLLFILSGYVKGPKEAKTNQAPAVGTTYVLYSKTCPFCQKAKKGMRIAATLYSYTPVNQPVQYVDIDKDTKIANSLRKYVKYKASLVKLEGKGKYKTAVYGLADKSGKAQTVSASHAYQKLLEVR